MSTTGKKIQPSGAHVFYVIGYVRSLSCRGHRGKNLLINACARQIFCSQKKKSFTFLLQWPSYFCKVPIQQMHVLIAHLVAKKYGTLNKGAHNSF